MNFMLYPTFEIADGRIIPNIRLPRDFEERVPVFYEQEREQDVVDYSRRLIDYLKPINFEAERDLVWDDGKGLVVIRMKPSGGLDLVDSGWIHFQEHNLGGTQSLFAGAVAMKYVSELLKSNVRD